MPSRTSEVILGWRPAWLLALLLLAGCRRPAHSVLIVHNSQQARWIAPLTCDGCKSVDIAKGDTEQGQQRVVVFDGHSLPGIHVLGQPTARLAAIVRRGNPELVVMATCYGAELQLLDALFSASDRVKVVMASPLSLPWAGFSIRTECLSLGGQLTDCFTVPSGVHLYTRNRLAALKALGEQAKRAVHDCAVPPRFVRLRPHYLCLEDKRGAPGILRVTFDDLNPACIPPTMALVMVDCGNHR